MIGWERSLTLLHSNYNYEYLKRQRPGTLAKLLQYVRNQEIEQKAWEKWLVLFLVSHFSKEAKLQPFETYLGRIKNPEPVSQREYDDILKKAEETKTKHQKSLKR